METIYLVFTYILTGLLGLCIGSFLNVVIYRVPLGMSVAYPPSHCPNCHYKLKWYDNIPILSYCILKGKCRGCGSHISFRYTIVELANMIFWLGSVFLFFSFDTYDIIRTVCTAVLASVLICVCFIDWEHQIIPDRFSVILAVLGVVITVSDALLTDSRWMDHLIGLAAGGGFFLTVYLLAKLIYKREGIGFGDVKLMAAAGLYLGWIHTFIAVLIGSVTGSVILLIMKAKSKSERFTEYPFAPFLTVGILIVAFFGDAITLWYLNLLSF